MSIDSIEVTENVCELPEDIVAVLISSIFGFTLITFIGPFRKLRMVTRGLICAAVGAKHAIQGVRIVLVTSR